MNNKEDFFVIHIMNNKKGILNDNFVTFVT